MQRQMEAHERSPTCSSACTDNVDANALPVGEEAAAAVRAVLGAEVDAAAAGRAVLGAEVDAAAAGRAVLGAEVDANALPVEEEAAAAGRPSRDGSGAT
jgi:hypothetical protein